MGRKKKYDISKLDAVCDYIKNNDVCRNQFLLNYLVKKISIYVVFAMYV